MYIVLLGHRDSQDSQDRCSQDSKTGVLRTGQASQDRCFQDSQDSRTGVPRTPPSVPGQVSLNIHTYEDTTEQVSSTPSGSYRTDIWTGRGRLCFPPRRNR